MADTRKDPKYSARRKSRANEDKISRTFLEVMLFIALFYVAYASFGKPSMEQDYLEIKEKQETKGQGVDLEQTVIIVTPAGYMLDGQMFGRDDLIAYLQDHGSSIPALQIEPDQTMHENLRWLLDQVGDTHDIKLAL